MNEMTNNTTARPERQATAARGTAGEYRPRLTYYHPNARGTGSAIRFELHPAHDDTPGSIFTCIARQISVASRVNGVRVFPRFDWKSAITTKLDISDLSKMLEIFRGISERIADGKGLFHRSANANTIIKLEHLIEPIPGYAFSVSKKNLDAEQPENVQILFSMSEALGLSAAIEHSLGVIAFGIPKVIPRAAHGAPLEEIPPMVEAAGF